MKLEGRITILVSRESTTIEIEDENANNRFLNIKLNAEDFCAALSRQAMIKCELEIMGLDKIGKKHENKSFEFKLPKNINRYHRDDEELRKIAQSILDEQKEGWICDGYFRSQNSFFTKDGEDYARATIRRWI